jgi:hypothetical protein
MEYIKRGGFELNVLQRVILQHVSFSMGPLQGLYDDRNVAASRRLQPRFVGLEHIKGDGYGLDVLWHRYRTRLGSSSRHVMVERS